MAAERPSLDDLFLATRPKAPVEGKPSLDDLFQATRPKAGDGKTAAEPKTPYWPVKEDVPGIVASAAHGVTQGLTDIGREPISKIISGYPGESLERGFEAAKNPGRHFKEFARGGPAAAYKSILQTPLATPETAVGFPVAPRPVSSTGQLIGLGTEMLAGYGAGKGVAGAARRLAPGMEQAGTRIAQNILHPTGRFAKRSEKIAKTALDEGVLRGSAEGTRRAAQSNIDAYMDEVDRLAENSTAKISVSPALRRMDALTKWYKRRGDTPAAEKVMAVKNDIVRGERLTEPVFENVETSQFVMGPAGKSVKPQITEVFSKDMKGPLKQFQDRTKYQSVKNTKSGKYQKSDPLREILTDKTFVENPEDIVAMNVPGGAGVRPRKIVSISPKEEFELRPEIKGISRKETIKVGERPKEFSAKEVLRLRRDQDALMKTKKAAPYDSSTTSPEIMTRQEYTGGLRRSLGQAVPEIGEKNRKISKLIDVASVAKGRASVASRNNLLDIVDSGLSAGAVINPKLWIPIIARKLYQGGKGITARTLYAAGKAGKSDAIKRLPMANALAQGRRFLTQE